MKIKWNTHGNLRTTNIPEALGCSEMITFRQPGGQPFVRWLCALAVGMKGTRDFTSILWPGSSCVPSLSEVAEFSGRPALKGKKKKNQCLKCFQGFWSCHLLKGGCGGGFRWSLFIDIEMKRDNICSSPWDDKRASRQRLTHCPVGSTFCYEEERGLPKWFTQNGELCCEVQD